MSARLVFAALLAVALQACTAVQGPAGDKTPSEGKSEDLTWHRVDPEDFDGSQEATVRAVVADGDGGAVAVGTVGDDAAAWWSEDLREWRRSKSDDLKAKDRPLAVTDVVRTDDGYVAVGFDGEMGQELMADIQDAAVWISPDGEEWSRVAGDALAGPRWQDMMAVANGPAGLVAVGRDDSGLPVDDPRAVFAPGVWRSTDGGHNWERAAAGVFGDTVLITVAGDDNVYVTGASRSGDAPGLLEPVVWFSTDGLAWQEVDVPAAREGYPGRVFDVADAEVSGGFYAAGDSGPSAPAALWYAKDGRTWAAETLPDLEADADGAAVNDVAETEDDVVAVGTTTTKKTSADEACPGQEPTPQRPCFVTESFVLERGEDGWEDATPAGFRRDTYLGAIAAVGTEFVVAGRDGGGPALWLVTRSTGDFDEPDLPPLTTSTVPSATATTKAPTGEIKFLVDNVGPLAQLTDQDGNVLDVDPDGNLVPAGPEYFEYAEKFEDAVSGQIAQGGTSLASFSVMRLKSAYKGDEGVLEESVERSLGTPEPAEIAGKTAYLTTDGGVLRVVLMNDAGDIATLNGRVDREKALELAELLARYEPT